MTTALLCITFYILGASSFGVLALLMIAHRNLPPPTFYHRRWRDNPLAEVVPQWEREEGVRYEWMNLTGLEDK